MLEDSGEQVWPLDELTISPVQLKDKNTRKGKRLIIEVINDGDLLSVIKLTLRDLFKNGDAPQSRLPVQRDGGHTRHFLYKMQAYSNSRHSLTYIGTYLFDL